MEFIRNLECFFYFPSLLRSMKIYKGRFRQFRHLSQETFQRRFNIVFGLIWRRDVTQRQINVKTTLCTSTFKFTAFSNVETGLCISTLNWTTLDNVETTLSFSTSIFTTLRIWPFEKKNKARFKNKIIFLSFKKYVGPKRNL